jgi:hypothetical protein
VRVGDQGGPVRLYAQSKDKFLFDTLADQNFPESAELTVMFERAADGKGRVLKRVMDGPGGAEILRRLMVNIDGGTPEKSPLGPNAADVLRHDRAANVKIFGPMGAMTSITYKGTTPGGWDTYRVLFAKGDCIFGIHVDDRGVIQGLTARVN